MEQPLLSYLMLMTVLIVTLLKLLENGLWIPQDIYSMWSSWDMHIGSCQSQFLRWGIILFLWIRIDMTLLLLQNNYLLPKLRQVQSFIRLLYKLIIFWINQINIPVMKKIRSWLGNSTFTKEIACFHWLIYSLQKCTKIFQCRSDQSFSKLW